MVAERPWQCKPKPHDVVDFRQKFLPAHRLYQSSCRGIAAPNARQNTTCNRLLLLAQKINRNRPKYLRRLWRAACFSLPAVVDATWSKQPSAGPESATPFPVWPRARSTYCKRTRESPLPRSTSIVPELSACFALLSPPITPLPPAFPTSQCLRWWPQSYRPA